MTIPHIKNPHPNTIVNWVGLGLAVSILGDTALYIVLPTQYAQVGLLAAQVGIILSVNRGIRLFINGPYGVLIERIPRRWMLIPSMFLGALSTLLYTVGGFEWLVVGRLLWGIAWAGIMLGTTTVTLDVADGHNRGYLVGRLQMWQFIGLGISSLLGGVLFDTLGYNSTFWLSAFLCVIMAILWWLWLPETYIPRTQSLNDSLAIGIPATPSQRRSLIIAMLIYGVNWLVYLGAFMSVLPVLLQSRLGDNISILAFIVPISSFTGFLSAFNTVISLITSPLSGWLSDRTRSRWGQVSIGILVGIGSFGWASTSDSTAVLLASMLNALILSVLTTQLTAIVGDYARQHMPHQQGRLLGVLNTLGDSGGTAGPILAFALLPTVGVNGVMLLCAIALIAVWPFALWVWRKER